MAQEFSSISHLLDTRSRRSAWIGGGGTVLKYIFGTLDEDDGIRYNEAIESVQTDQKKLATLMKENILVTTSVISKFNDTLNRIKINEANLNQAIDKLSSGLQNVSIKTDELLVQSYADQILINLETAILVLSFQIEDIVNSILFSSHNIIHPSIINSQQLYKELAEGYRHLPDDSKLPIILDLNSIHFILNISKIICYYVDSKIIFVLQIPLVSTKEFMLFHTIALPIPHSENKSSSFSLVIPNSKFIAMTKDKVHYCNLDSLDYCKTPTANDYICDVTNVYASDARPSCESELMSKVISEIPVQCETKFIYGKIDIWKPINNNKWIYVQTIPNKISIDCMNSKLYEDNISGTGIITIPSGCTGYCRSTTLLPKNIPINVTSPVKIPDFNLLDDSCCNLVKLNKLIENVSPVELKNVDLDNLNSESNVLLKTSADLDGIVDKPHIIQYGTHYSILLLIISFIISILIIYKTYLIFKKCTPGSSLPCFHKPNPSTAAETPAEDKQTDGPDP